MRILLVLASIAVVAIASSLVGPRYIKSSHGTYLRAVNCNSGSDAFGVDATTHAKACEQWRIERHGDEISIRTVNGPLRYLRAHSDHTIDLAESTASGLLWDAYQNADDSWSFRSAHGTYLRAQPHGRVSLQSHVGADEKFTLELW